MFKRATLILFLFPLYSFVFSQSKAEEKDATYSLLKDFKFDVISIKYKKTAEYNLWGTEYKAHKFVIKALVSRTIHSEPTVNKRFRETYALYVIDDKSGVFKDSLLLYIKDYLKEMEGHYHTPNMVAYERNVIDDSLNNFILYSYNRFRSYFDTPPQFDDPQFSVWMNNKIYCFQIVKSHNRSNRIENFIRGNVKIKKNSIFTKFHECGLRLGEFIKIYNEGKFDSDE